MARVLAQVVVSGANGWIGKRLTSALDVDGVSWVGLTRQALLSPQSTKWVQVRSDFDEIEAVFPEGARSVVHLAARVHQMNEGPKDALKRYRSTNLDATVRLARAAKASGVSRFIFISTVKALGEVEPGRPWRESDTPCPTDPYGISKLEAEQALLAMKSPMFNPTIVRLPLVYGAGVSANFKSLSDAVARGVPLPLGCATAKRSLIGMENLIDAVLACLRHAGAPGETFHVADEETPSVKELVHAIGVALGRPARLLPVPTAMLRIAGKITGREASVMRLTTPLRLDTGHIATVLGWRPKVSLARGLAQALKP
jgi:UDP-glucose 4-epimerase